MAYTKTTTQQKEQKNEGSFKDNWSILGSGWKPKSGGPGVNILVNEDVNLTKGMRLNLFATKTKKDENSPDYVLCAPKDQ